MNNEHRVLCCVLILKQIEIFYRVISSPLSRPPIWAMCLPTSEVPGASSADGRAMRTAVRVPDRERCVLLQVRVWTCSTALESWLKGYTTRRGYVESDGTSSQMALVRAELGGPIAAISQPPTAVRHLATCTRHWACTVHCREFACCQCHLDRVHTILTSRELM
jgi:hypothetical protein